MKVKAVILVLALSLALVTCDNDDWNGYGPYSGYGRSVWRTGRAGYGRGLLSGGYGYGSYGLGGYSGYLGGRHGYSGYLGGRLGYGGYLGGRHGYGGYLGGLHGYGGYSGYRYRGYRRSYGRKYGYY